MLRSAAGPQQKPVSQHIVRPDRAEAAGEERLLLLGCSERRRPAGGAVALQRVPAGPASNCQQEVTAYPSHTSHSCRPACVCVASELVECAEVRAPHRVQRYSNNTSRSAVGVCQSCRPESVINTVCKYNQSESPNMSECLDHSLQLEDGGEQAASSPAPHREKQPLQVRFHLHVTEEMKDEPSLKLPLADISLA